MLTSGMRFGDIYEKYHDIDDKMLYLRLVREKSFGWIMIFAGLLTSSRFIIAYQMERGEEMKEHRDRDRKEKKEKHKDRGEEEPRR